MPFHSLDFPARRAILWLLSAFSLALAVRANNGEYSGAAIAYLTASGFCAVAGVFFPGTSLAWVPDSRRALDFVLGATVLVAQLIGSPNPHFRWASVLAPVLLGGLVLVSLFPSPRAPSLRNIFFLAFLSLQAVQWCLFIQGVHNEEQVSPYFPSHVRNDVQIFAEEAARLLTAGKNPYSTRMPNVMGTDMPFYSPGTTGADGRLSFGYPYLPLTALWSLPGYWLGDFRFTHAFALIGAALLLGYGRTSSTSQLAASFLAVFPSTLFILALSWIEPIAIFFLASALFCYFRMPKWLFLALGCLVASKQYTFFLLGLLPLLIPDKQQWRPLVLKSVGVALLLTLPMALWDWDGFYRSVIEIQFRQPFREDSLSYLVTILRAGGPKLPPLLGFAALFGGLGWGLYKAPRVASAWCGAAAVAYLGFFAFNKQAFANYYFWPFGLLAAAVAVALPATQGGGDRSETTPEDVVPGGLASTSL